jgi:hypothetical protein
VRLVVRDALGVIDASVQSHVETEGEQAHGGRLYQRRSRRAAAGSLQPERDRRELPTGVVLDA